MAVDILLPSLTILESKRYRIIAERNSSIIETKSVDDMQVLPIEQAKALLPYPLIVLCTTFVVGYGWILETWTICD